MCGFMRCGFAVLLGGAIVLAVSSPLRADCLPTLGTDNCLRSDYFQIQPLEHRYLDAPTWREPIRRRIHESNKKAAAGAK